MTIELFALLFAWAVLDIAVGVVIGLRIAARKVERRLLNERH